MKSELDVLIVDERVAARAIAGALRPLSVTIASAVPDALAAIALWQSGERNEDEAATVRLAGEADESRGPAEPKTRRALVVAQEFRSRIPIRLHPMQITLTKPQLRSRWRRGTLAKPFNQAELARALAVELSEPVHLQSLGTAQASIVIRGEKFPLGPRSLAIAQVHHAWKWSDPQTIAFRYFLDDLDHSAIGTRIGKTRAAVKTILRRAAEAASFALEKHFSAIELRSWLLGRCVNPG